MKKRTNQDTNKMTWAEFENLADKLVGELEDFFGDRKNIHVITPLHRTGGIVSGVIANKLDVVPILPAQFKYSYNPTEINQIISIPDILVDIPEEFNVVMCEGNTSTGSIAKRAAKAIKDKYPKAKIYLATLTKVYGCPDVLEGIEKVFYGVMTDENLTATEEEIKNLKLREGVVIFPWEDEKKELNDINADLGYTA